LGVALADAGDLAAAEEAATAARDEAERALVADHPHVAEALLALVRVRRGQARPNEARELAERALAIATARFDPPHVAAGDAQRELALAAHALGEHARATRSADDALSIFHALYTAGHPRRIRAESELAPLSDVS
jgi:hypothetical protein